VQNYEAGDRGKEGRRKGSRMRGRLLNGIVGGLLKE